MKSTEGFFAGQKAFNLIATEIGEGDKSSLKEIIYNGFSIRLNTMLIDNEVIGIGEPYATIAKKMKEHFK